MAKVAYDPRCDVDPHPPLLQRIREFEDVAVYGLFPKPEDVGGSGSTPRSWYAGTVRYNGAKVEPGIFRIYYDDGTNEEECYELLRLAREGIDNTMYWFPSAPGDKPPNWPLVQTPPKATGTRRRAPPRYIGTSKGAPAQSLTSDTVAPSWAIAPGAPAPMDSSPTSSAAQSDARWAPEPPSRTTGESAAPRPAVPPVAAPRRPASKRVREPAIAAPADSEHEVFYEMAKTAKIAIMRAGVTELDADIEARHTYTFRMKEYVFLLEAVLNYHKIDVDRFKRSLKWANNIGAVQNVFSISDEFGDFLFENIFNDGPKTGKNADKYKASVKIFKKKYSYANEILTRHDYITNYRFDACTSGMMQPSASQQTCKTITHAHKKIFDRQLLAGIGSSIQTMPYGPIGECTCYLCGKKIDVGRENNYTKYGELDHMLPKTIAFIMNVIDTPLNYSPTHGECNGPKSTKLPFFDTSLDNPNYIKKLKASIQDLNTFKYFTDTTKQSMAAHKTLGKIQSGVNALAKQLVKAQQQLGLPPGTKIADVQEELRRRTDAEIAKRAARGGAMRFARTNTLGVAQPQAPSVAPADRALRSSKRLGHAAPAGAASERSVVVAPPRSRVSSERHRAAPPPAAIAERVHSNPARQTRAAPAPSQVAAALKRVRNALLSRPIAAPRDVIRVSLLTDLVDFYEHLARIGAAPRSQSGGAPGAPPSYTFNLSEYGTDISGEQIMSYNERVRFINFRYRMMYTFSFATYEHIGSEPEYVALIDPSATPDQTSAAIGYAAYILKRLDNCLKFYKGYRTQHALLE